MRKHFMLLSSLVFLAACATSVPAEPPVSVGLSPGVAWVVEADEWADLAAQTFAEATDFITTEAARRPEGSWAVVLDLDETVMNNVQFQVELEQNGGAYSEALWSRWTQRKEATLVPGAEAFLNAVNAAGGHVAFVTNRADSDQLATEENLAALGITRHDDFRILLTRAYPKGSGKKDPRYDIIPAMLKAQGYEDVELIAYLGDNVGDKPENPGEWTFFCINQGEMYGDPCAKRP